MEVCNCEKKNRYDIEKESPSGSYADTHIWPFYLLLVCNNLFSRSKVIPVFEVVCHTQKGEGGSS